MQTCSPHCGTFTRVLGKYEEDKVIDLNTAIENDLALKTIRTLHR
jgi:hypothetical protein